MFLFYHICKYDKYNADIQNLTFPNFIIYANMVKQDVKTYKYINI